VLGLEYFRKVNGGIKCCRVLYTIEKKTTDLNQFLIIFYKLPNPASKKKLIDLKSLTALTCARMDIKEKKNTSEN
jgi:hypothetical protein